MALSSTSPDAVKKAMADNNALNVVVAQRDAQIQQVTAQLNKIVVESNQNRTTYDNHVAQVTAQYAQLFQKKHDDDLTFNKLADDYDDLKAQLAALKSSAPPPQAGGNIPAAYAPVQQLYPQVHQAAAHTPPAHTPAADVKQESGGGGGGFLGMFGFGGRGTAHAATDVGAPPGDTAALRPPVQASPATRGRRAGGAAAGSGVLGLVAARASAFTAMDFVDPMEMSKTGMKRIFTASPFNITIDDTSEISTFTSIISSTKYQPLLNQLASTYNIDPNLSATEKINLLINVYKLTRYIFELEIGQFNTFVAANNIVLQKQHNSQTKTAAALKSKTRSDVLGILKLPEVVAAFQAMN